MYDLEIGKSPALVSHVLRNETEALGLDFSLAPYRVARACGWMRQPVGERRENQPVPMKVSAHEENRSPDGIEPHGAARWAQITERFGAMRTPGIAVESRAAANQHAIGMNDISVGREQRRDQVAGIIDHIDVQPEHPVFVIQRPEQKIVPRARQHLSTRTLEGVGPARNIRGHLESEILLDRGDAAAAALEPRSRGLQKVPGPVLAVALEQPDRQLLASDIQVLEAVEVALEMTRRILDRGKDQNARPRKRIVVCVHGPDRLTCMRNPANAQMTTNDHPHKRELQQCIAELSPFPAERFAGEGIVICAGGPALFTNAYVLVHVLRRELGCELPIEIWHLGPGEMSPRMAALLAAFGVLLVDAEKHPSTKTLRFVDGWQLKVAALMGSAFEHVILLDADQVPTRDPAEIFDWPAYRSTGAVLWPDVADLLAESPIWSICGLEPRRTCSLESGQLAVQKRRGWPALQVAAHLNARADFYYRMLYGDKDTYLLGFLLTDTPFSLVPHQPLTDLGFALYQRDFDGNVLFQHRTGAKWRYGGAQKSLPGFFGQAACERALADLRRQWNGLVFQPPVRSAAARAAERAWTDARLDWREPGQAARPVSLLADGEIGHGRARDLMNWFCEESESGVALVFCDSFGPSWRLVAVTPDIWQGTSLRDQQRTAKARRIVEAPLMGISLRTTWPMPGRYSSLDEADL